MFYQSCIMQIWPDNMFFFYFLRLYRKWLIHSRYSITKDKVNEGARNKVLTVKDKDTWHLRKHQQ